MRATQLQNKWLNESAKLCGNLSSCSICCACNNSIRFLALSCCNHLKGSVCLAHAAPILASPWLFIWQAGTFILKLNQTWYDNDCSIYKFPNFVSVCLCPYDYNIAIFVFNIMVKRREECWTCWILYLE